MMENTTSTLFFARALQRLTFDLVRYTAICDRVCTEELDVTGSQGYTLLAIPEDESISMNDLSLRMRLASSTMTRMVEQLVQKGMVDRQTDAEDRRVVRVYLTERGAQAKQHLEETLTSVFTQVLQEIPEGERASTIRSLEMLTRPSATHSTPAAGKTWNPDLFFYLFICYIQILYITRKARRTNERFK